MNTKRKKIFAMNQLQTISFAIVLLSANLFAATSVKVYSFDEGLTETNISKPRIYIENNGTTTLIDFVYYYYFTSEETKTPVPEDYDTPESEVSLEQVGIDLYRLKYQVSNVSLTPGQLHPNSSGNVVGLHYNDWGAWNKENDYSNNRCSTFTENTHITVYVNGTLVYGDELSSNGGAITHEVWTSISGTNVSSIPLSTLFNSTGTLSSFEEPQNWADNYGTRLRGYITAPSSGTYYFWIAGDDCCELRLSSNDRPENKSPIASVNGYTSYRQWNKYTSQKSAAITLVAGQRYYVEALHKEGGQNDNLSVGWAKPGESTVVPSEVIPGSVLTSFVAPNATPSLTASLASPTQINLSWNDNCTNEDGYRVERSVSGGTYNQIADIGPNTNSFQNTGLSANSVYSYRVRAYNSQGFSSWSNVFTLTTQEATSGIVVREVWTNIPGTDVSAIPTTTAPAWTTTLTLLQEPSNEGDNCGSRIRGYIKAPSSGSFTFWISGDDDCDFYLSTTASPSNKTRLCYVDGYTGALEWNKYSSQKSAVRTLTAGQNYYFEILHKEGAGGDNMAVGWLKPGQSGTVPSEIIPGSVLWKFVAPAAPSNLAATAASGTQINLTWSDNSDNEEFIIIEQSLNGTNFTQIASKTPDIKNHSVTGLLPANTYTFRVRAINSAGNSEWSPVATATTQQTTAGAISRQVWLNVPAGSGIAGIPLNTTPNYEGALSLLQEPANYADNFGSRVRGYLTAPTSGDYTFWISGDDDCELWLSTGEDPAGKVKIASFTGWTDPLQWNKFSSQKSTLVSLIEGKRYYIEVLHIDGISLDHMAVGWAKPGESTTAPSEIIPGPVLSLFMAPTAPLSLAAITVSSTQIDLSWTDNSDNETGFLIERALAGQSFTQVATIGPGAVSYAATGLDPNTQYQFRIRATSYAGNSDYSSTVTAITGQPGDQEGPVLSPQLLSFAIYSQDLSIVKNQSVFSGGGAVGSNTLVQIELDAVIGGDIVSGGNVVLKDRVDVQGDVTCGGTLSTVESAPPTISGTVTENASVTVVAIPVKSAVAYGTTDVSVNFDQTITLAPGSYKDLKIERGATVTFTQGVYNFKSFTIGNDATALFDVPLDKTIEINIETSLEFLDRATAKFATTGYAPCVKIYTNDYSVRIGTEVNLNGILTAPNAAVTICSRTHIEGAVYAKSITIEPDAVLVSNCVDPNDDDDGDCVLNLTEMVIGDAPNNNEDYTLMGVPTPAMIDNTQDQTVFYNFGCKYPYFQGAYSIPITYPAGSLTNASIAPAYTMMNNPSAGIPEFSMSGYKPVGNYMSMIANSLKPGQSIRIALPLYSNAQPMVSYTISWYNADSSRWEVSSATPLESGALLSDNPISDVSAMIIVQSESRMVAYLDNGMTYSNEAKAKLRFNGRIDAMGSENPGADPGNITINYLEHTVANPAGVPDTLTCPITNYKNAGFLLISAENDFSNKITVTGIQINSPNFFPVFTSTENFVIDNGQTLTFEINRTLGEMTNEDYTGDRISAFYDVNAMTFESMGFSEGVIKNHGSSWGYHYYLRDHLGSTRMVVTDGDELAGAYMYQPYGTMDEVVTAAVDQVREKFTGKEFDQEGADENGVGGIQAYYFGRRFYDPEIGVWFSADPVEQDWNVYSYCGNNPIMYVDPYGLSWKGFWRGFGIAMADMATGGLISGSALATGMLGLSTAAAVLPVGNAIADIGATLNMINAASNADGFANTIGAMARIGADYFLLGGNIQDAFGHTTGIFNWASGGAMDFNYYGKTGNVIYSGGFMNSAFDAYNRKNNVNTVGSEYFGKAIFTNQDWGSEDYKKTVAHEMRHVRQMEDRGRFIYWAEYLKANKGVGVASGYDDNPFEVEADFYGWAYADEKALNIYGEGEITNALVQKFRTLRGLSSDWYPNKSWQYNN